MKNAIRRSRLTILLIVMSMSVQAAPFFVSGTIKRTLSEASNFGGCMIELSTAVSNGCPANGWVSLDCNGGFHGAGERHYASALMAFSLNKPVTVQVDNTQKYNGYCVARRIDVLY